MEIACIELYVRDEPAAIFISLQAFASKREVVWDDAGKDLLH